MGEGIKPSEGNEWCIAKLSPGRIGVASSRDFFVDDRGRPFFWLADTVWSAFTNADFPEWEEYLEYRQKQGFNVLQINILPQHDASESDFEIPPFQKTADGRFDYSTFNEEYFRRIEKMLDMAKERGFIPALVVLWSNYVGGTWLSRLRPQDVIPFPQAMRYVEYIVETFRKFHPVYIIGGDTDLESREAVEYYLGALEIIKTRDPQALTTIHLLGPAEPRYHLPKEIVNSPHLDFSMYQSGHGFDWVENPVALAQQFYRLPVKRPIVNGEPCYEGMGHERGRYGAADVRRAIWRSLLSGAKAGVTYGAHGIWSWHKRGKKWGASWEGIVDFRYPFDWRAALRFRGAWDVAFCRFLFEAFDLFDIEPEEESIGQNQWIRIATGKDKIVAYFPYATDVTIEKDLGEYRQFFLIDLEERAVARPVLKYGNGKWLVTMSDFNSDALLIGRK